MNYTEEQIMDALTKLNSNIEEHFLKQIISLLNDNSDFVLLDLFPDSGSTYIAEVLTEEGLYNLDLDVSDPKYSFIEEIDLSKTDKLKKSLTLKLARQLLNTRG